MELKIFLLIIAMLLVTCCPKGSESTRPHSSLSVAAACPGEQLTLTCTSNQGIFLRWSIILPEQNNTWSRNVPYTGSSILPPIHIEAVGVIVNFTRVSESGRLPLRSEMLIDKVTVDMNQTEIHCSPVLNESDSSITFIVYVRGANSVQHPLKVDQTGHQFEATNFTVTLNWTQEDSVSYNISIEPLTELVHLMNNTWQVIGNYNTVYNVSIVATLCDKYSKTTNITLKYATCEFPTIESLGITDPALRINHTESGNPATVGDSVTFYCLSGELLGQNRTTCLGYENWEPDPMANETMCKQVPNTVCNSPLPPPHGYVTIPLVNQLSSNLSISFVCQNATPTTEEVHVLSFCDSFGKWIPNPMEFCLRRQLVSMTSINIDILITMGSLCSVLFLSSVAFLVTSFICCCCTRQKQNQNLDESTPNTQDQITPVYEQLTQDTMKCQDTDIDFKANVAYGTARNCTSGQ